MSSREALLFASAVLLGWASRGIAEILALTDSWRTRRHWLRQALGDLFLPRNRRRGA
jgi:hypothetical protein